MSPSPDTVGMAPPAFCEACNKACVLMTTPLNKFQPRYEGYVLLKRLSGPCAFVGPYTRGHSCEEFPESAPECLSGVSQAEKLINLGAPKRPPRVSRKQRTCSRGSGGHQVLSRKKSRSQDSLVAHAVGPQGINQVPLNNGLEVPSFRSVLSRSESNIYNVHSTPGPEPIAPEEGNSYSFLIEMGELVRYPKKLLNRVTGEMSQLIIDLERWKEEYVVLSPTAITARSGEGGSLEIVMPYVRIQDIDVLGPTASFNKFIVRVASSEENLLLQRNVFKYRNLLKVARNHEVLLKEMKNLIDLSLSVPLHEDMVCQVPLELVASILATGESCHNRQLNEDIIVSLAPLLEKNQPSPEICSFFSRHCTDNPRSCIVVDMFTPVVKRILKHNVDFGKYPHVRRFVQDYIQSLNSQNDGQRVVNTFVREMHGPTSTCPHLRVLPNLMSVCTTAVCTLWETMRNSKQINTLNVDDVNRHVIVYLNVILVISEFDDWLPGLAQFLQPIPFPSSALIDEDFMKQLLPVIEQIGTDRRCCAHQMVLPTRDTKEGWLQVVSPASLSCVDDGMCWTAMLQVLITCCCKRKKFLGMLAKSLSACMLLTIRGNTTAQEVLCLLLEWELIEGQDLCAGAINALQSTDSGKKKYQSLCERQISLREVQKRGGPRKLALPCWSTDDDINRLLSSGSFGNLEHLSLAFTRVTSACAEELIKLPALRYLNLWATQFGDTGLQIISEHLHKLQVLNLCETPVSDKGLVWLTGLKKLRKLNLNSTNLSASTLDILRDTLPTLEEIDTRYTDAWGL